MSKEFGKYIEVGVIRSLNVFLKLTNYQFGEASK